jgi:hypothetical protein
MLIDNLNEIPRWGWYFVILNALIPMFIYRMGYVTAIIGSLICIKVSVSSIEKTYIKILKCIIVTFLAGLLNLFLVSWFVEFLVGP